MKQGLVLVLSKSPSETRPINCVGSKLKDLEVSSFKPKCINIKSTVQEVHVRLIYVHTRDITKRESTKVAKRLNYSSAGYVWSYSNRARALLRSRGVREA